MKGSCRQTVRQKVTERGSAFLETVALAPLFVSVLSGLMSLGQLVQSRRSLEWAVGEDMLVSNFREDVVNGTDTASIGPADVNSKLSDGYGEASSLSVSSEGKDGGSKMLSDSDKDAYSVWRWAVGEDTKAPANQGGWLFMRTRKEGEIEVKSVVVAPVEKNESGVGHLAFVTVLTGTENLGGINERRVDFSGKRPDQKDPASGVSITSTATIAPDGLTMSGQTTQEPFGESTARKVTYPWRAFLVRGAKKPKEG